MQCEVTQSICPRKTQNIGTQSVQEILFCELELFINTSTNILKGSLENSDHANSDLRPSGCLENSDPKNETTFIKFSYLEAIRAKLRDGFVIQIKSHAAEPDIRKRI